MTRPRLTVTVVAMVGALAVAVFLVAFLAGCMALGVQGERLAMRTIVTTNGTRYPCTYGVERDGYGYRCYKESTRVFRKSEVLRVEP